MQPKSAICIAYVTFKFFLTLNFLMQFTLHVCILYIALQAPLTLYKLIFGKLGGT